VCLLTCLLFHAIPLLRQVELNVLDLHYRLRPPIATSPYLGTIDIDAATIGRMITDGSISGGMIPKIEYALEALTQKIKKVHIINGTGRHSLLLELFTDKGVGTEVTE
jgi:hypothetical protein